MKNLLTVILVFITIGVFSQETAPSKSVDRKWVVKVQPVNFVLQSYSFEAERMLNAKNAVTLGIGIPSNGSLVGKYGIDKEDVSKAELGTMHIRGAYRHYTGSSGLPKGFYIEPYLKYQKINASATATSISNDETDIDYSANFKGDFHTLNAGFQMGVQFLIAKTVAIDFYFLGLEAGIASGNFTGTPSGSSNVGDLYKKVDQAINGKPADNENPAEEGFPSFIANKLKVTQTNTSVNVKASSMPYPWFRGGISIGIAF